MLVAFITLVVVALCVLIHLEFLTRARNLVQKLQHIRPRMVLLMSAILITHLIEISLFGFAYVVATGVTETSHLVGYDSYHLKDYLYYSAVVYSTLGFGDLVPEGPLRLLTGVESVTGLLMITWSASFAFLEMQRRWEN